jgi:DNA (cytosine-5)-methyltransferase 1
MDMKTTAEMTLGSLFDGIAGFPLAARRQGIKTVWASEIEPDCIDIAKRHFPEALQLGDITQIDGAKIPVVDIISFGSPCQDLSVAGKQTGLDGSRSGLFMEAVRITREMREKTNGQYPKYIIWENVAGAFSSNKGEDFRRVLEEITQSNISMPKSGKWATAGMVGNEGPGGGRSVYRMAIT